MEQCLGKRFLIMTVREGQGGRTEMGGGEVPPLETSVTDKSGFLPVFQHEY